MAFLKEALGFSTKSFVQGLGGISGVHFSDTDQ